MLAMKTTSRWRRHGRNSTGVTLAARPRHRPASLWPRYPPEPSTAETQRLQPGKTATELREAFGLRALERRFGLPPRSGRPKNSADESDALHQPQSRPIKLNQGMFVFSLV